MIPQNIQVINPVITSYKVCCLTIIRAVPKIPDNIIKVQSHQTGLNWNIQLYESKLPIKSPQADMWVLIFHLKLMMVQSVMHIRLAMMMPDI